MSYLKPGLARGGAGGWGGVGFEYGLEIPGTSELFLFCILPIESVTMLSGSGNIVSNVL